MKHKHAELIHAWADGAVIECRPIGANEWSSHCKPQWFDDYEYRIKPEEKKPVVRWLWTLGAGSSVSMYLMTETEAANRGWQIKLEWSRTEFPE